jgi:hypothetical protein
VALGSIEFKETLLKFEDDLADVRSDLYEALNEKLPAARVKQIVSAGKKKLTDYDALLGKLSGTQRKQAEGEFSEQIDTIRDRVAQLTRG